MPRDLDHIRRELAELCRKPRKRFVPRSREIPCDWRPLQVTNPETGLPFSEPGAWHFVADRLDDGNPITEVPLHQPPGATGYEMTVTFPNGQLYIKMQLGLGGVIGRSFHMSVK